MKEDIIIVGAGLTGATAAALLKEKYHIVVYEKNPDIGGLLYDKDGIQHYGPHAFYTDHKEVWEFVNQFAEFKPYDLRVYALSETSPICELPRRLEDDLIFQIYSEKAWGMPFDSLPYSIQTRVPQLCTDHRIGYHAGKYKGQPVEGYYQMLKNMLNGVEVRCNKSIQGDIAASIVIWTGNINDYTQEQLPWIGRNWTIQHGELPYPVVNYATYTVPQLRSYDCQKLNPYFHQPVVISEFKSDEIPCYPYPDKIYMQKAKHIIEVAKTRQRWLCGRLGSYQYLDMEQTILNIFEIVQQLKDTN